MVRHFGLMLRRRHLVVCLVVIAVRRTLRFGRRGGDVILARHERGARRFWSGIGYRVVMVFARHGVIVAYFIAGRYA